MSRSAGVQGCWFALALLTIVAYFTVGCGPAEPPPKGKGKIVEKTGGTTPAPKKDDHEDHDHDHAHGPHGGALVDFLGGKAEWITDEKSGKLTVFLLDKEGKKETPITAEKLVVETSVSGKKTTYDLSAVKPKESKAHQFELESKELEGILDTLSEKITATLQDGKGAEAKIEKHEHKH